MCVCLLCLLCLWLLALMSSAIQSAAIEGVVQFLFSFMIFYFYFGISVLIHLLKGGILFFDERLVFYVITRYSKPTVTRQF